MTAERHWPVVPAQIDLPATDHEILALWRDEGTFSKALEQTRDGQPWNFYEGPPTANGQPGTHHVEARVFKDMFPRYQTMQGRFVDRRAGWDCHGLPVELAVEKEIGINGKPEIEAYGIEKFNARCRASVHRHVDAFTEMTERMGYWVDFDEAYWTMNSSYVESVWWALKQIFDKGLLSQDHRVAPYCPRCGTGLSDHEVAQGYEDITDPSVYVRFPLTSGPLAGQASLLVWTTTPWTLVSNTAVAVHPEVTYLAMSNGSETLVVAEPLVETALPSKEGEPTWQPTGQSWTGRELERWAYERPFDFVSFEKPAHFVVLADYVTTTDGTGLVHQAPAFGADDMTVCRSYGLEVVNPIQPDGHFGPDVPLVGGEFFKAADPALVADLTDRGLMFRKLDYLHAYPHCWRCHTPLMYYAQPSWYIRTTQVKDQLIAQNEATTWHPDHIKHGRYGDWLENNIDWALSRSRYWGTPLPIWRNDADPSRMVCIGSLAELSAYAGRDLSGLDPHRPFIDEVTFTVDGEEGTYRRVPDVIDGWFDSGAMPFAQFGYPWVEGSKERFEAAYPADFICEGIDQTRGWFYTLMAVGTLVFGESAYRDVLCLGLLLAEDGRKMSKHLGNILLPIPLMDDHGADAVRWFMAAGGSPWASRRVGDTTLNDTVRKVILTYWNTVAFHALYARVNNWLPGQQSSDGRGSSHVLDRWLRSRTQALVRDVTAAMDGFDSLRAGQLLEGFVDELSNWYVRRSRRRFWDGEPGALQTLQDTLQTLTLLMAPIMPFVTEKVWQQIIVPVTPGVAESVHLAGWPTADESAIDADLDRGMALTKRLVELGRGARAEAKVKIRQPLRRALVPSAAYGQLTDDLRAEICQELNVQAVESFANAGDLIDYEAKGNFRNLGKRFGKQTPVVAKAIAAADAAWLASSLPQGPVTLEVTGFDEPVEVGADDVLLTERPREGWSVINEQGETVALDLELTPELVRAGLAREVVRLVQETRKNSGFEVSDRISLTWFADGDLAEAVREHADLIADEVLATSMAEADPGPDAVVDDELGLRLGISKA
ncbi:isoleucine--tRNA ligase [Parenemella sanctibonifatiensis]|uniref:Isoleucine--tRNA ligase n=1 Tax=Parenemella sanctibonifatiensis TaxID=2016505 RepID=A0A255ESU5_9ACTN|nr:isoleucine--tRNA ligase [Parenemella sanctibonifatiensis]OYN92675.1 isoleucine--tRNA ligase [Parenemella sanctibonifatiensis]